MDSNPQHHVMFADRVADGIMATFEDGRTALFSADWLYRSLGHASFVLEVGEDAPEYVP